MRKSALLVQGQIRSDPRIIHNTATHLQAFPPPRLSSHVWFSSSSCRIPLVVPAPPHRRADLQSRDPETFKPLHVVNMTIKDSPEESAAAAGDVLELCRTVIKHRVDRQLDICRGCFVYLVVINSY